jgi:cyanophycinase
MLELFLLWLTLCQTKGESMSTVRTTPHYTYYHRGSDLDAQTLKKGGVALMGGSTDVDDVFSWMAEQGGNGDFLVLRGSGSDGYQDYIDEVARVNSVSTVVIKDAAAASDPFVLDKVQKAEAIFFAGGDQWNYVGKWKGTPLLTELNKALLDGVPMGGTSAGLAILGEHVFSAQSNTITSDEALQDPYHPAITLESEFLAAPNLENVITDSHFSERHRMGRLVTFMSRLQADRDLVEVKGIGVDERTAVLVGPDGSSVTRGEGAAHFVRAYDKPTKVSPGEGLSHQALETYAVSQGQRFDLSTWTSPDVEPRALKVTSGNLSQD